VIAIVLAAVVLVGGVGAAAALVLTRPKKQTPTTALSAAKLAPTRRGPASSVTSTTTDATTATSAGTPASLLPDESQAQMTQDIQQVLLQFHQDISGGSWQNAWNLLSVRKQQQSLQEFGYNGWIKNQKSLGQYLDPSGLEVSLVSTDPSSGVATVDVTGMTWSPPGRSSCPWSGITWVLYENGNWRYDPGYSTTPQRRAQWGPPQDTSSPAYSTWLHETWPKLMGAQCVPPD
jgi:hypothetical protein